MGGESQVAGPTNGPVKVLQDGSVVVLTIESPPVNTLRRPVRRALFEALATADADPATDTVVITGRSVFSAGADLEEFDSGEALAEPDLHRTISGLLDRTRLISIAAIRGAAVGGGLELALACRLRIAAPDATLGLPETTLGFMPGAGGTQRLPRAVGIAAAVDLIATGRTVDGTTAHEMGLVDAVAEDPLAEALTLARSPDTAPPRRLRDRQIDEHLASAFVDIAIRDARRARRPPGVIAALDAMEVGSRKGFDVGLDVELASFERLASSPEAKAARYRFRSDKAAGRGYGKGVQLPVEVGVVGGGTMGQGIAAALLAAGSTVSLIETDSERADAAAEAVRGMLARGVKRGRISQAEARAREARLVATTGITNLARSSLVIEAVFETLELKLEVFRELDLAAPGAILASNTSSLDLDAIASTTSRPEDVVGMHFFSPADTMALVEVVRGRLTSHAALDMAVGLSRAMGKTAVIARSGPGFIGNRIFDQYLRQAVLLLHAGVSPERVDAALEAWGMAMGPFKVLDLIGNDVTAAARRARGDTDTAWSVADALVAKGWYGRKSGLGWYRYEDGVRPNDGVRELLPDSSGESVGDVEIVDRCILAMVNEAARVLSDGIATDPRDIDTVLVRGYGFPAARGGPIFYAREWGAAKVIASLKRWHESTGDPFWRAHGSLAGELLDWAGSAS